MDARTWLDGMDAVLFDMDDTLVATGGLGPEVFAQIAVECGLEYDPDEFLVAWGRGDGAPSLEDVARRSSDAGAFVEAFFVAYRSKISVAKALPGVAELLDRLDQRLAIVTGADRAQAAAIIAANGWEGRFDVVCGFEDYGIAKPDPAGYRLATRLLDVDPTRCVAVEDSPAGVASARAARLRVVGVRTGQWQHLETDVVVDDLTMLG